MKLVYLPSGIIQMTPVTQEIATKIQNSPVRDYIGIPTYYCGDWVWPKNGEGYVISDVPEAAE